MYIRVFVRYDFTRWNSDTSTNYRYLETGERIEGTAGALQKATYEFSQLHHDSIGMWPFGVLIESESGSLPPVSPDEISMLGHKSKSINRDFKKRCQDGEIIMSPYTVFRSVITSLPEDRRKVASPIKLGEDAVAPAVGPWKSVPDAWYWNRWHDKKLPDTVNGGYLFNGYPTRLMFNTISTPRLLYTETVGHPRDPGLNLGAFNQRLHQFVTNQQLLDHTLVQEIVGKANAGDVDVLTALAELPKTLNSVWDGFRLIAKIVRDARKKEFQIWKTVPSTTKRYAKASHQKWLAAQMRKIPSFEKWQRRNPKGTMKQYHDYVFSRKAKLADLDTFIANSNGVYAKRASREAAEAVASVHLNATYNIKPAVYTIEDTIKAIDNFGKVYRRYGNGSVPKVIELQDVMPKPHPNAVFSGVAKMEQRCLIKRQYDASGAFENLKRVASVDILVTGYELIKLWSIIFDWFFTIGPMLRALPWNQVFRQQKSCYNYKTVIDGYWVYMIDGVEHKVRIEYEGFHREIINPHASIGIYWKPEIDSTRAFSALSFLFMSMNGNLKRRYA